MIGFRSLGFQRQVRLLPALLMTTLLLGGCQRDREGAAWASQQRRATRRLTELAKSEHPIVRRRAQAALAELKNARQSADPIIIYAKLAAHDSGKAMLGIKCFDEDRDLRGLLIEEVHLDPNGATQRIKEHYPVYISYLSTPLFDSAMYDVEIRNMNQRKDENGWRDCMVVALDEMVRWHAEQKSQMGERRSPVDANDIDTPPIWISIPEPNDVRVYVSVYDRAGHESDNFELSLASWERPRLRQIRGSQQETGGDS